MTSTSTPRPEMLELLDRHPSVVAYLNGHDHRGGYGLSAGGVHHVTIAGMVQSPLDSNAYSVLRAYPDRLELEGFGTQVRAIVMLKPLVDCNLMYGCCMVVLKVRGAGPLAHDALPRRHA
jgi:hypothetical protein